MSHDKNIYNQDLDWHSSRHSCCPIECWASVRAAKNNLEKASRNIKRAAEDTSDILADKLDSTAKATRRNAEDTLDRIGEQS